MPKDLSSVFSGEIANPIRSTFLTVLCILTFVGSAYNIFSNVLSLISADKLVAMSQQNNDAVKQAEAKRKLAKENNPGSKFALKMMESSSEFMDAGKIKTNAIASIIAHLISLTGAILMWRLNKVGFYVYVAGVVAGLAAFLAIYGTGNMVGNIAAIVEGFFGLVFIIMYAFNLKDMKPMGQQPV